MDLVAYAEPSGGTYPGHIVIGHENGKGAPIYYGFRFNPAELPEHLQDPATWRGFLIGGRVVPGYVEDETERTEHLLKHPTRLGYTKRAACGAALAAVAAPIPARGAKVPHAAYSFSPDMFHTSDEPCYNCVTWATEVGNRVVAGFLSEDPTGRIKTVLTKLTARRPAGGKAP